MEKEELLRTVQVDAQKIICRTCAHQHGGTEGLGGKPHYTKGVCVKYPYPKSKPNKILFEGADCPLYEKE